jgi:hypothetical protein
VAPVQGPIVIAHSIEVIGYRAFIGLKDIGLHIQAFDGEGNLISDLL